MAALSRLLGSGDSPGCLTSVVDSVSRFCSYLDSVDLVPMRCAVPGYSSPVTVTVAGYTAICLSFGFIRVQSRFEGRYTNVVPVARSRGRGSNYGAG